MKYLMKIRRASAGLIYTFSVLFLAMGTVGEASEALSIEEIQSSMDEWGGSTYAGEEVTISGIVTATYYYGYVVAEAQCH